MVKDLETIQYDGIWWLPGKERKKIHGRLNISCKGESYLNLVSSIDENNHNGDKYELVFGFSNNGRAISLQYCLVNESPVVSPGLKTQRISVENVYVAHTFLGVKCKHYDPAVKTGEIFCQIMRQVDLTYFQKPRKPNLAKNGVAYYYAPALAFQ